MTDVVYPEGADLATRVKLLKEHEKEVESERARIRNEQVLYRQAEIDLAKRNNKHFRPETTEEEHQRAQAYQAAVDSAREGSRYQACLSLCGNLAAVGFTEHAAWAALQSFGARCQPPMANSDLRDKKLDKWLAEIISPITRHVIIEPARTTPRAHPSASPDAPDAPQVPEPSYDLRLAQQRDWGHALELWDLTPNQLRWANHRPAWMEFDGRRWVVVPESRAITIAAEALRVRYATELANCADTDRAKRLLAKVADTCTTAKMAAALRFYAGCYPVLVLRADEWDAHPWTLNCMNGAFSLRNQTLDPHDATQLLTRCTAASYNPNATAPAWEAHIRRFLPNAPVRRQVQRDLGRSLVGTTLEESLPIWYGTGANGKTTTTRVISAVLGNYARQASPDLLVERKNEQHPTAIADLLGSRLVFAVESDSRAKLAEPLVKMLTGGDRISTRFMRGDFFEAERTFDLILISNHQPAIHSTDEGIWRRIRLVPWTYRIPDIEQRPQEVVVNELSTEAPGILNWMLDGLRDWQEDPRWIADTVITSTTAYREEQDILAEFLAERCEFSPRASIPVNELYENYVQWCGKEAPIGKTTFGRNLRGRGIQQKPMGHDTRKHWLGIRISTDQEAL